MAQQTGAVLSDIFEGSAFSDHPSKWNACWEDAHTPWDRGGPSLALYDLLVEKPELVDPPSATKRKTALVPGCGRGHDVLLLSSLGYDTYGLDFSAGAVEEAKKNEQAALQEEIYKPRGAQRGQITWLVGDYYADDWLKQANVGGHVGGQFDLIYDYTFFCAMPPSARPQWAARMVQLLAPHGRLVCLEFPSTKNPAEPGPPWALPPHAYLAFLSRPGEEIPTDEHGGVITEKVGPPTATGLTRLAHLKPKRTHAAGMENGEGDVQDWISVWSH